MKEESCFLLFLIVSLLVGCQKEEVLDHTKGVESGVVKCENGRLVFKSKAVFDSFMKNDNNKDMKHELIMQMDSRDVEAFELMEQVKSSHVNRSSRYNIVTAAEEEEVPELIPDEQFVQLVNDNGEIQVADSVYRITSWGTFITTANYVEQLDGILMEEPEVRDCRVKIPSHKFYSNKIGENLYRIDENIVLLDTYKRANEEEDYGDERIIEDSHVENSSAFRSYSDLGEDGYNNLPTKTFGAKTIAGKAIQGLFGRNEDITQNFERKRRVKVVFYDLNFQVCYAVGCKVVMQKKNWVGWSGTDAEELRLGWDYVLLEYTFDQPNPEALFPKPDGVSGFPKIELASTGDQFALIDIHALGYGINYTLDLDDLINGALTAGAKSVTRYLFNQLKSSSVFLPDANSKIAIGCWKDTRTLQLILERTEMPAKFNGESIWKKIDQGFFVGVKIGSGGSFAPIIKDIAPKIKGFSVYGMAKYNNVWKGGRIVFN